MREIIAAIDGFALVLGTVCLIYSLGWPLGIGVVCMVYFLKDVG